MAGRYQQIFHDTQNYYLSGSPVIIRAMAVQKDNETGRLFAQVKLANISDRVISGCKLDVLSGDSNWGMHLDAEDVEFSEVNAGTDSEFGTKIPVYLNNDAAECISVNVKEVYFSDGEVWNSGNIAWSLLPAREKIVDRLGDLELIKQYSHEVGKENTLVPVLTNGLFMCGCGAETPESFGRCRNCGKTYADFAAALDIDGLTQRRDERLRIAEEERLEKERLQALEAEEKLRKQQEKKRKTKKTLAIVIPVLIVLLLLAALTPKVILPAAKNLMAYNAAQKLLKEGEYDQAKAAFIALGDYKDSPEKSDEAVYLKADAKFKEGNYKEAYNLFGLIKNYKDALNRSRDSYYKYAETLLADKQYEDAIKVWTELDVYSDSEDRIKQAEEEWKGDDYQKALNLMNDGKYEEAAAAFEALGDYRDAEQKISESFELKKNSDYETARSLASIGEYGKAVEILDTIPGYKDSDALSSEYAYLYAVDNAGKGNYETAIEYYRKCLNYSDSKDKIKEVYYLYGCELLDAKKYTEAIKQLNSSSGYKDADKLILKAKYNYVCSHRSRSDSTTSKYLDDLVSVNYSDSKTIYKDLYAWKMEVVAINNSSTSTANYSSVSKNSNWYYHLKLTGGPEGGSTYITCKGYFPNGSTTGSTTDYKWYSGETGEWYFYYYTPAYGSTGTFRADFYDDKGNKIGSASVYLTN